MTESSSISEENGFRFWTQGNIDGSWDFWTESIWNWEIIYLDHAPQDGVYTFETKNKITENTKNSKLFNIAFRCDYWSSGSFRVRNVKVERVNRTTEK